MRTLPVGWRPFFVEGCQEGEDIGLGRDSVGGYSYGSVRWMERRTPEEEDIGPGKDSVGGYN